MKVVFKTSRRIPGCLGEARVVAPGSYEAKEKDGNLFIYIQGEEVILPKEWLNQWSPQKSPCGSIETWGEYGIEIEY